MHVRCIQLNNDFARNILQKQPKTRSCSQVEGSRINGRIRNILIDFSTFSMILQNTLIPVSYMFKYTMKKVKNPLFS